MGNIESTCIAALQKDGPELESVLRSCPWTKMASPNNVYEFDELYIVTGLYAESARKLLTGVDDDPHGTVSFESKLDRAIKPPYLTASVAPP